MKRPGEPTSSSFDQLAGTPPTSAGYSATPGYADLGTCYHGFGGQLTPSSSTTSSQLGANGGSTVFTPTSDTSPRSRGDPLPEYFPYSASPAKPAMNHQSYLSHSPTHISTAPSYPSQSPTTGEMSQYSQYPQVSSMPSSAGSYAHTGYSYYNSVTSPQSATQPPSASLNSQLAPLSMAGLSQGSGYPASAHHPGYHRGEMSQPLQPQQQMPFKPVEEKHYFDSTGQVPPPGVKPRVTATLWEDEGSLCFQVEAKGVCVARREDNHFVNGTKLLNVAGMTRGRRDGILKSEKIRHVVKIGPMHLKGVWIPFERALDFANREKITEMLYPLFVHNISALLYHPHNGSGTRPGSQDLTRRKDSQSRPQTGTMGVSSGPPSAGLHHHHSMNGSMSAQSPHSIAPHPSSNRPEINRAHTFPTPPTSASAIMPPQPNSYDWGSSNMPAASSQPLTIETSLGNTRSMPSTPATTPPANSLHSMPSYAGSTTYGGSYSATPHTPNQYTTQQHNMARFGQPMSSHGYVKSEMGPPSRGNTTGESEHAESIPHGDDGDNHESDYHHRYSASQASFNYTPNSTMGSIPDHGHLPEETSPPNGTGRVTPRNSVSGAQWSSGYNTPPRTGTSLSYGMGPDSRQALTNGHADSYSASYSMGGSAKRGRDDDEEYKVPGMADSMELKRRKSNREGSISGAPVGGYDYQRPRSTVIQGASR